MKIREILRKKLGYAKQENTLSPRELHDIITKHPMLEKMYGGVRSVVEIPPNGFVKKVIGDNLLHFHTNTQGKKLLVCFSDKYGGMFMPVPSFLQVLGDQTFDVLIARDPQNFRFVFGIQGLTTNFDETVKFIAQFAAANGYASISTLGTSMGGLPSIRAGLLLGAERAVSIGGTFRNDERWYRLNAKITPAFDPICPCYSTRGTEIALAYCENVADDRMHAGLVQKSLPSAALIPCASTKHDIFSTIHALPDRAKFLEDMLESSEPLASMRFSDYISAS